MSRRLSENAAQTKKLLVVIDDTPECHRALLYAARRSAHFQAQLLLLSVILPDDFASGGLFGVGDVMRSEAQAAAEKALDNAQSRLNGLLIHPVQRLIREGQVAQVILQLVEEDHAIMALVLGAGTGKDGPGPLVSSLSKTAGHFPIPVILVPGHLTDDDLAAIT